MPRSVASASTSENINSLLNPARIVVGLHFKEETVSTRPLPGTPVKRGTYTTVDVASRPRYAHDEDGWVSVPSGRIVKRRARRAARRQERKGWLGSASASLKEPTSTSEESVPL